MTPFHKVGKSISLIFSFLGILFLPFPYHLFSFQNKAVSWLFTPLISLLKPYFFQNARYEEISSDSSSLYALILILLGLAIILGLFVKEGRRTKSIFRFIHICIAYYLGFQLLNYGFAKIFKGQFYLPEPNTLFTPVGFLDKDILYWTTIGSSYSNNLFLGVIEAVVGFLLLFQRTRFLGFLGAVGVFINVVAVNFGFDISVKVLSTFLLGLSLVGISHYSSVLRQMLFPEKAYMTIPKSNWKLGRHHGFLYPFLKSFVILVILFEALFPILQARNKNDDLAKRPFLHGAYEVFEILENGQVTKELDVKRIFIHRKNYIIFQNQKDQLTDFKMVIDTAKNKMLLMDYNLNQTSIQYAYSDSLLILEYIRQNQPYKIKAKSIDLNTLPLMRPLFHWTIDEIK